MISKITKAVLILMIMLCVTTSTKVASKAKTKALTAKSQLTQFFQGFCWYPCYCWRLGWNRYRLCWCWYPCFCWHYGYRGASRASLAAAGEGEGADSLAAEAPSSMPSPPGNPPSRSNPTEEEMVHYPKEVEHSEKYTDDFFEYKHVIITKEMYDKMPKNKLLSETQWRALGIAQSKGWIHYTIHKPEPHILLFKRLIGTDPKTGTVPSEVLYKLANMNKKVNI